MSIRSAHLAPTISKLLTPTSRRVAKGSKRMMAGFGDQALELLYRELNQTQRHVQTSMAWRRSRENFIGVTPYIYDLAQTIPIEEWYSDKQVFAAIVRFMRRDYDILQNKFSLFFL